MDKTGHKCGTNHMFLIFEKCGSFLVHAMYMGQDLNLVTSGQNAAQVEI